MSDIQLYRYGVAVNNSILFKKPDGRVHEQLARTMFRLIKIRFYLIGDPIMHAGEKNSDIYILLDGEVDLIDVKGKKLIKTLKTGDHFGEITAILKAVTMRTTTAIATKICQIGIVTSDQIEMLMDAFPDWHDYFLNISENRMKATFEGENIEEAISYYENISKKISSDQNLLKKYQKRTEKLISPKIAKIQAKSAPSRWLNLTILHMLILIYTGLALPLEIGFDMKMNYFLLTMEIICVSESFIFFIITSKYSCFFKPKTDRENKDYANEYLPHYFYLDLIAMSPLNCILASLSIDTPYYLIVISRLLRTFSVFRLSSLFTKIEFHLRKISFVISAFKVTLVILIFIHWLSCIVYWINLQQTGYSWVEKNNLKDSGIGNQYSFAIFYVLNIITCTGYGFMNEANDLERVMTIILIFLGDSLSAIVFGLMATVAASSKSELQDYIRKLNSPFTLSNKTERAAVIMSKLKNYYAFSTSLTMVHGSINFFSLYEHLPPNIVSTIIYECNKNMLKKIPYFQCTDSSELFERIAVSLRTRIFLPKDYLIYKDDSSEEMFFIIEGTVDVVSLDGKKIIKTLRKGSVIGDLEIISNKRPTFSVIAKSLCLTYYLHKSEFNSIIKEYPDVLELINLEIAKKNDETMAMNIIEEDSFVSDEASLKENTEYMKNIMDIYTSIDSPMITRKNKSRRITLYAGLKNLNSKIVKEIPKNPSAVHKLNRRRPHISLKFERRNSQESLGREMMLSEFSKVISN